MRGRDLNCQEDSTEELTQPSYFPCSSSTWAYPWCMVMLLMSGQHSSFCLLDKGFKFPLKHQSMSLYCLKHSYDHMEQPGDLYVTDSLSRSGQSPPAAGESFSDIQKGRSPWFVSSSLSSSSHWVIHAGSAVTVSYWNWLSTILPLNMSENEHMTSPLWVLAASSTKQA